MKRWMGLLTSVFFAVSASASEPAQKITFRNGAIFTITFVANDQDGSSMAQTYQALRGESKTPARIEDAEETDRGKYTPVTRTNGELYCFEIAYDAESDRLSCGIKSGYTGWFFEYYSATADGTALVLEEINEFFIDETDVPDNVETKKNDESTVILYKRKH